MGLKKLMEWGVIGILKTIFFNFSQFPLRKAIFLPVILSSRSSIAISKVDMDEGLIISDNISFGMIKIGFAGDAPFNRKVKTIITIQGSLNFKGKAYIGRGSVIIVKKGGYLDWGNNSKTTGHSSWSVNNRITIGDNCLLSWDILFMDGDGHEITDKTGRILNQSKPIVIGNHVWIGCRCTILKGAIIPDNSIIGACSLVTKSLVFQNSIYFGNDIKMYRSDVQWAD